MYLNSNAVFNIKFILDRMKKLNLDEALLQQKYNISSEALRFIFNNEASKCLLITIYKLSEAFLCSPNELFSN